MKIKKLNFGNLECRHIFYQYFQLVFVFLFVCFILIFLGELIMYGVKRWKLLVIHGGLSILFYFIFQYINKVKFITNQTGNKN